MTIQEYLYYIILPVLVLSVLLVLVRFFKGPTINDKIVALDLMITIGIGIIAVYSIITDQPTFMDIALIFGLIAFLSTTAFAYYLEKKKELKMSEIIIAIIATLGAAFILLAAIGLIRMPDLYLRISTSTKAVTLGIGFLLTCAAVYFQDIGVTSRAIAIIFFVILTAPVGAHLIGRSSYISGVKLWEKTKYDDLKGMYDEETHKCGSGEEDKKLEIRD